MNKYFCDICGIEIYNTWAPEHCNLTDYHIILEADNSVDHDSYCEYLHTCKPCTMFYRKMIPYIIENIKKEQLT